MYVFAVETAPAPPLVPHGVTTLGKPASLPPIVIETSLVAAVTDEIWFAITSSVVAPLQATKTRSVFARCLDARYGYADVPRWQPESSVYEPVPVPDEYESPRATYRSAADAVPAVP